MKTYYLVLMINIVNLQSMNLEIHNNLFKFIRDNVISTVIKNLKQRLFTIDDGRILSNDNNFKYYLNLGGGEYYAYFTQLQLHSVQVEKFQINERNEFEIVLTNIILKKFNIELEIFKSLVAKLLGGRFIRLEFQERQNGYQGPTIERIQIQLAFVPSRNLSNNIPFIKIRNSDIKINYKNLKIKNFYKKDKRYQNFDRGGFRQLLVQKGASVLNSTIQGLVKWCMNSVLEGILNFTLKSSYVNKYEIEEQEGAADQINPFDDLETIDSVEDTEMDEELDQQPDDALFFDANLYETPLIGGRQNKRLLLKFKGIESTLQRFEQQLKIDQSQQDDEREDHPIAQVLVKKRFVKSLKKVKEQYLQDILSNDDVDNRIRIIRV